MIGPAGCVSVSGPVSSVNQTGAGCLLLLVGQHRGQIGSCGHEVSPTLVQAVLHEMPTGQAWPGPFAALGVTVACDGPLSGRSHLVVMIHSLV